MVSSARWRLVGDGGQTPFDVSADSIVGRSRKADLRLPEGFVSRRHARLWTEGGRLMVEDLGSANGTFVNGDRIHRPTSLVAGDRVRFDEFEFTVAALPPEEVDAAPAGGEDEDITGPAGFAGGDAHDRDTAPAAMAAEPEAALSGADRTGSASALDLKFELPSLVGARKDVAPVPPVLDEALASPPEVRPGALASTEVPAQPFRLPAAVVAAPALLGTKGALEGHLIHLEPGRILLGRGMECDIWVDDPGVSRSHLEFLLVDGSCRVRQLGDARGALLNDRPVSEVELLPGDRLTIGDAAFVYDSAERLLVSDAPPPWLWMLAGFLGAGALLLALFAWLR